MQLISVIVQDFSKLADLFSQFLFVRLSEIYLTKKQNEIPSF